LVATCSRFKEQRINEGKARNQRDKDQRRANEEREAAKSEQKKRYEALDPW
jgi:hypothetical protein